MAGRRTMALKWLTIGGADVRRLRDGERIPRAERPAAAAVTFDLEEATIADLQARMTSGQDTARSLVEKYTARIAQIDRQGPALRSVIELNPDAVSIADELRRRAQAEGRARSAARHSDPDQGQHRHGRSHDDDRRVARARRRAGAAATRFSSSRLRDAGAVILGKTNLSEWANFRSTHSTSGWSARGGQTKNPYALDRNPCGSSSGSGVAVAANLAAAAIGTETDGSIVCPAHSTSLVGFKPTVGLVSRTGIVPISHSQDTAGPMTRTVADAAAILSVLDGAGRRRSGHRGSGETCLARLHGRARSEGPPGRADRGRARQAVRL